MTVALAFLASTATPAGGRALSRSDRAAIEHACRPSPLSPDERVAGDEEQGESVLEVANTVGWVESSRPTNLPRKIGGPRKASTHPTATSDPPWGEGDFTGVERGGLPHAVDSRPIAICLPGDTSAAEYAAAAGCSVIVLGDSENLPPFDIAWFGNGFLEQMGEQFAAVLAEQHAASLVFDVLSSTCMADGALRLVRSARAGARDVIDVSGPVVLVVSESTTRPSYVSRYRRQQARRQVDVVPAEVPVSDCQPVRPRTKRSSGSLAAGNIDERTDAAFGMTERQTSATDQPIIADPKTCAEHLVRYLAHHGFLQRGQVSPLSPGGRGAGGDITGVEVDRKPEALAREDRRPSLASASGFLKSPVSRRPRLPQESNTRRLRQPRRVGSGAIIRDRRPRRIGQPGNIHRGPRRIPGSPTSI